MYFKKYIKIIEIFNSLKKSKNFIDEMEDILVKRVR